MNNLRFLNTDLIRHIIGSYETPIYIYSESILRKQARQIREFPHAFGFTPRYAMKANPNRTLLQIFGSE